MSNTTDNIKEIFSANPNKIVLSKAASKCEKYKKIVITRKISSFQIEKFTEKQAFHENTTAAQAEDFCHLQMQEHFLQLNAWDNRFEHILLISKKGKISYKKKAASSVYSVCEEHNKKKKYILE